MAGFGSYLKEIRKKRNLTLREVQNITGISNAYLSQLENGKIKKPSPSVLEKLSRCYDISYAYLLELSGYPIPQSSTSYLSFRRNSPFDDLTKEEEEKLLEFLEFIRSKKRLRT